MASAENRSVSVREARGDDAAELARLLTELGHPTTAQSISTRWDRWSRSDSAAYVAEDDRGRILGLVTTHRMEVLHRPRPVGRITALIVDPSARGLGIGKTLVRHVEASFTAGGCGLLEVTSHAKLTEAHAFYEHVGYERTSTRFARTLA